MSKVARSIMLLALITIAALAFLSILGAFYGAEKAKLLFNSIALQFYFSGFFVLIVLGFMRFQSLLRRPGLLMIHAGCLLILAGAMWSSESGHQLAFRLFGSHKIPKAYMVIEEGFTENLLFSDDFMGPLGELPFSIKLKDFRLEYYPDKQSTQLLNITTADDQQLQIPAEAGQTISLWQGKGKITVVRTFKNFKIQNINGERIVTDEEGAGVNPAVQVEIQRPDGSKYTRYVFELFPDFEQSNDTLQLSFVSQEPPVIRDFLSEVTVIKNGKEIINKTIEVNHPLHYGGYHFYQHSYDTEEGKYTILSVTSDSGLYSVYAGYWLLCLGVIWHFWLRHIANSLKQKEKNKILASALVTAERAVAGKAEP